MHTPPPETRSPASNRNTVLVIDSNEALAHAVRAHLEEAGYQVDIATASGVAIASIDVRQPKLLITDIQILSVDGVALLCRCRDQRLHTTVVITAALGHLDSVREVLKIGAYDYVTKPINYGDLALVVHRAMERQTLLDEIQELQTRLNGCPEPLFSCPERGMSLGEIERELLMQALQKFGGNQTQAAAYLGISRRTLIYRMEKYKLRS